MSLLRSIASGLRSLFRKEQVDGELNEELRHFLEMATEEKMKQGMNRKDAVRAVRLERGNIEVAKEIVRAAGWESLVEEWWQDSHFAARILRKSPGFSIVAIVSVALGIGASTSIFSVVDAVLLRPLPYPNPQQIVRVWEQAPDGHRISLADPNFEDFRAQNHTLSGLALYIDGPESVSGGSEPVRANVAYVSQDFFTSLGVEPFRGRAFAADEQVFHGAPAMIISYGYWQQFLGGAADISHVRLTMDGTVYPVIGVMPRGFNFPPGVAAWVPRELVYGLSASRRAHGPACLGRLLEGVTVEQARADLDSIARRIRNQYGEKVDLADAAVTPFADAMVGDVRTALLTLFGAVCLLLLVACANVAGLLLARTSTRRKELAVRTALGAGRGRLIRQFLAESFALSFSGGVLGILVAILGGKILPTILPTNLPRQEGIGINISVLLFALVAIVAVAFSLGLFVAWRAGAGDLQGGLSAGSRSHTGSAASQRLRSFLVIGEIATTLVILVGAGLLGRSFLWLISTSPGFREENLITMEFSLPIPQAQVSAMDQSFLTRQIHQMDDILSRLRAIPGAESVGLAGALPVAGGDDLPDGGFLILNGQRPPANFDEWEHIAQNPSQVGQAIYCVASEGYFRTLGIPIIRGRLFGDQENLNSPNVALISQSLARQQWPNQDPIGQVIEFGNMDGNMKALTIVGVVGDVRAEGLDRPPSPIIYVDYRQRGLNVNSSPTILIRSAALPAEVVSAARGIFRSLAPDAPVKFSTFADEMGGWLADRRFLFLLVGLFAAAALALAAVGVYGAVAFSVMGRTQEIGIRMALGCQRTDVLRLVLGEGARMAALGVGIGIAISMPITRLMSSLLFGISATDPLTFVGVAVLLSLVALLASYIPARRAMRVDPIVALRYE
jgi:putative ABC transport system permease protein